jgi:hypothetical protein
LDFRFSTLNFELETLNCFSLSPMTYYLSPSPLTPDTRHLSKFGTLPNLTLLGQADAADQFLEARVCAQRVELGFQFEVSQPKRSMFKGLLQPREGLIVFL